MLANQDKITKEKLHMIRNKLPIYFLLAVVCATAWYLFMGFLISDIQTILELLHELPFIILAYPLIIHGLFLYLVFLDFGRTITSEALRFIMETPPMSSSLKPGNGILLIMEYACKQNSWIVLTKFQQFSTLISAHVTAYVENNFTTHIQITKLITSKLNHLKNLTRITPKTKLTDIPHIA